MNQKNKTASENRQVNCYSKKSLLLSRRFSSFRDLLEVLLEEETMYSIEEAEKKIGWFLKKGVNE